MYMYTQYTLKPNYVLSKTANKTAPGNVTIFTNHPSPYTNSNPLSIQFEFHKFKSS